MTLHAIPHVQFIPCYSGRLKGQEASSTHKPVTEYPKNISEAWYKCVCLNATSIVNKKNEFNIMVEDINPHIIGITESWANKDILDAELELKSQVVILQTAQS